MPMLTEAEIAPSAIEEERKRLREATQHVTDIERQIDALHRELATARTRWEQLRLSVQWRELMAAVNADEDVYAVVERLTGAFAAFRESLVEPENYLQEQKGEVPNEEDIVPYSDTDDYADFSEVETVVEEVLATVKEQLESRTAASWPSSRNINCSSSCESSVSGEDPSCPDDELVMVQKAKATARRQALLKLLVITVLMGRVEQYCGFKLISEASNVPRSDAEEMRDGVTSVWQWLFHEQPGVLTAEESAEWKDIVRAFLGDSYAAAP
ncbi:hypothetical protein LPMP_291730 [Leishmania panamensis]|uniref:Uncharacterized protein n=2 Tax=Leishmania guyanensis species complex TaxID=38579 RepID=A0A088RW35_LEIPA|nr:hypothetical protein LPMP_291730 [Leishmania panamensis]AIO00121.1 hypothetical protein LPMP_291730 [Leishmania panamensis]